MNIANSLTPRRVNENVQLNELFDGAMSAALTRGQLPPRQRRLHHRHQHRHHHRRRPHQRHFHHLKVNNNNHHSHNHSLLVQHTNNLQSQRRYSSHQQNCRKNNCDKLEIDKNCENDIDEAENVVERRPKVNPIFLWALQKEQRIVEVRCEDYDKRNRIKLTKTPHGWRSIPRTSSNVYNSCSCPGLNRITVPKDEFATSSQSVSSTSISSPISEPLESASVPRSSLPQSIPPSQRIKPCNRKEREDVANRIEKSQCEKIVVKENKLHISNSRYISESDECNTTPRNVYRRPQKSFDSCYIDDEDESTNDMDFVKDGVLEQNECRDNKNIVKTGRGGMMKSLKNTRNSKFVDCDTGTFKYIDLEEAQKNQLLQPRVVLEPLNSFTVRLNRLRECPKLDDEIEMIVEGENSKDGNKHRNNDTINDTINKEMNNDESRTNYLATDDELFVHCSKTEDSECGIEDEDIDDEIDDKDEIEELDGENPTVFEYDDRDSADMMDDDEFVKHDEVLTPTNICLPIDDNSNDDVHRVCAITVNDNIVEERKMSGTDKTTHGFEHVQLIGYNPQVPDLKPIHEDSLEKKTTNDSTIINQKFHWSPIRRLLPSPPCSVTCSEDASQVESSRISNISPMRQRREAPDLIQVHPAVWRKCSELVRPALQLRKLIEKSGHLIPDPLLVPRNCLPALAANPGVEIPRLLVTRPELRLPEAVMRPELLADPDILVISLSHLQQVLDAAPDPVKFYIQESADEYGISNNGTMLTYMNSNKKRLSVKPIGSLMPTPIDLSQHTNAEPNMANSIFHKRCKCSRQEPEVTSTARLPGDDSRLWHPLFGSREKILTRQGATCPSLNSHPAHDKIHKQRLPDYQQTHQDINHQHHPSWHRTTLAS